MSWPAARSEPVTEGTSFDLTLSCRCLYRGTPPTKCYYQLEDSSAAVHSFVPLITITPHPAYLFVLTVLFIFKF